MAGPWEQYQQATPAPETTPNPQQGPWTQFQAQQAAPQDDVIQEQHPDISFKDRFVAKNLANSTEAQAAYLKQQHPDLDVKVVNDQVVAKKPSEFSYKVMDPSGLDLQDISDVAYDVPAGLLTGAATAAGGVAGAPTVAGALPAAAAAGAGTSASLEALRQKLGQWAGVPQNMDYGQVATQGAVGAAAPVLFGTGAGAAQMAKAGLTAAEQQAQKSLVMKGINKAVPQVAESVSGVPKEAIKTLFDRKPEIDQLREGGITDIAEASYNKLREGLAKQKQQVGQRLEEEITKTPAVVDISGAKQAIDTQISKLESSKLAKNPEVMDKIEELKAAKQQMFSEVTGIDPETGEKILQDMPSQVDAKTAFELQDLLKQQGDLGKIKSGLTGRFSSTETKAGKEWGAANLEAYKSLNDQLSQATEGMSSKLKNDYRKYIELQNKLDSHFKSPEKTAQTLQGLNAPGKQMLKETLADLKTNQGIDLSKEADLLQAYKYFNKPSLMPLSSGGTTSTSRTALAGTLGYLAGHGLTKSYQGGLAGAAAANYLTGPKAVMYGTNALSGASKKMAPFVSKFGNVPPQSAMALWNMMQQQKQENK